MLFPCTPANGGLQPDCNSSSAHPSSSTHCCSTESFHGIQSFREYPPALAWSSPRTAGQCLLRCGLLQGLQENLCFSTWSTSSPSSSPTFMSARLFLTLFPLTPPSVMWHFLPFLKYVFPEMPPSWVSGSAVLCGGSVGGGWSLLCLPGPLLTDTTPASLGLQTPWHWHLIHPTCPVPLHSFVRGEVRFLLCSSSEIITEVKKNVYRS